MCLLLLSGMVIALHDCMVILSWHVIYDAMHV